jgi:hypothetical protein
MSAGEKFITERSGIPDMSGDSRGNFLMKTTNPNFKYDQKDLPA